MAGFDETNKHYTRTIGFSGAGGGDDQHIILQERINGSAGSLTSGTDNIRLINTIVKDDTGEVVDEGSGRFTLPAGTYIVKASFPAVRVGGHQAWLRKDPAGDDTVLVEGTIQTSGTVDGSGETDNRTFVEGEFTISVATSFEFQHRCNTTKTTNGAGNGVRPTGASTSDPNIFGMAHFIKTA